MNYSKNHTADINFKVKDIVIFIGMFFFASNSQANKFNSAFLSEDPGAVVDLYYFNKGAEIGPGKYPIDIYVNNNFIESKEVTFSYSAENGYSSDKLFPGISLKDLERFGVNVKAFPELRNYSDKPEVPFDKIIPDSAAKLDISQQRLNISIPQAALIPSARGFVAPERWDNGINALLLNYTFNGSNSWGNNHHENYYLNLQGGLNLGAWRLRDYTTVNYINGKKSKQHVSTYLQRSINSLRSELTLGDSFTNNSIFDSITYRGVQIASDDSMLPDSLRGYAPVVRGTAKGNARVEIRQNGYVIYQTYVPPGSFAITDLFPTNASGDLQVKIYETSGKIEEYTVPYSTVPLLQREGHIKYSAVAGTFRGNVVQKSPTFFHSTFLTGLQNGFTLLGGIQLAENYSAGNIGIGKNIGGLGAVSVDLTHANSTLADDTEHKGQSMRFLYAKSINSVGTTFQLSGYRYSTEGYYTLSESATKFMSGKYTIESQDGYLNSNRDYTKHYNLYYTKKGKLQTNISQQVGRNASIYLTGSYQNYWHTSGKDELLQAGLSSNYRKISYNISLSYNKSLWAAEADKSIALSLSVPINSIFGSNNANVSSVSSVRNTRFANFGTNTDGNGKTSTYAGVNGTLLDNNSLSYSAQQSFSANRNASNLSADYKWNNGNVNAGYYNTRSGSQVNYGISGGMVLHDEGLTLSQSLGNNNVLIKATGAQGISIENATGIKTDWRGYAVVPYASSYRQNRVALDPQSFGDDLDIDEVVQDIVPTNGAIVKATFNTKKGYKAFVKLTRNGKPVPFGADVNTNSDSKGVKSIVNDNGLVYLSGLPKEGKLYVRWGEESDASCVADYKINTMHQNQIFNLSETCR